MENACPLMVRLVDAEAGPATMGAKVYENLQVPPAASVTPAQFWVTANGDGAPPATVNGPSGAPDTLVTVADIAGEVVPMGTDPKLIVVGATEIGEAPRPVPDIEMEKFSVLIPIVVLEDFAPGVVGWNW